MKKEIKNIYNILLQPYMRILPGNMAFSFTMAIIPIISIIVFILNFLNMSFPLLSSKFNNIIPEAVLDTIFKALNGTGFNNILFLIIGLWASSAGMDALIIASDVIYGNDESDYLKRKAKAIVLTFLVIFLIVINLGILVFGSSILNFVVNTFGLSTKILTLFNALKWPIAIILIFFIVKIIYVAAPSVKIKSKTVNKGALFTTIFWIISSAIYSFYAGYIANYGFKYGSFANIIILLVWLYIMSFVLSLGTAINVNEYNK